jgi:hypothetical protein
MVDLMRQMEDGVRSPGAKALWGDVPGLDLDTSTSSEREARNLGAALARWENEGGAAKPSQEE